MDKNDKAVRETIEDCKAKNMLTLDHLSQKMQKQAVRFSDLTTIISSDISFEHFHHFYRILTL